MHKTSHARRHTHTHTQTRTHARTEERTYTHTHTHTHTHTQRHYSRSFSASLSPPPEKCSRYHPRTALVPFLSSQRPFPVPLGYPQENGLKRCSTGKKNSQILFSLASFLLMSSYSYKRMSRDQIQKQPTVRASLLVGTRRCHKLYTHAQNVAHTHARTHAHTHTYALIHKPRMHARARTHTHTGCASH